MPAAGSTSLAELAADSGEALPCAGNLPLDLGDAQSAWFVEAGALDIFLAEWRDGAQQTAPKYMLRAGSGRLVPGVPAHEGATTLGLRAKGTPGTVLRRLQVCSLARLESAELALHVDEWVSDVSAMLSRNVAHRPRLDARIEPGAALTSASGAVSVRRGVAWVAGLRPRTGLFMDLIDAAELPATDSGAPPLPLTTSTWITMTEKAPLSAQSSEALAESGILLPALAHFHGVALELERLNTGLAAVDQANVERESATSRRSDEEDARRDLFNVYGLLEGVGRDAGRTALPEALRVIGRHEGFEVQWPERSGTGEQAADLQNALDASGVRARQVRLSEESRWWTRDCGAMLAFRKGTGTPVALLPGGLGNYREMDPVADRERRITVVNARLLEPRAWLFYAPLPVGSASLRDLSRLARPGLAAGAARSAAAGFLAGLATLLPAVALGLVVDRAIPAQDAGLLHTACLALAAFGLIAALLHVLQGTALMGIEGRATSRIEAAFWDRLLRLPPSFLERYTAGELAMRGITFQSLRDAVQGAVANTVLSVVFLSPALILIVVYDAVLGGVATAFGLLSVMLTISIGLRLAVPRGRVLQAVHYLAGRLFEIINGIAELRVAGAEGSAFGVWARKYRDQKHAELQLGRIEQHLHGFRAALPFLTGAVLLLAAVLPGREPPAAGSFLAAVAAFMVFQTAVGRLGDSFGAIAAIVPSLRQVQPFLAEPPETSAGGEPVESLGGEVVLDRVSFRYDSDGPLILDDVSIRANPGEFVAIAGRSGAGKSTLLRLALGLDQPTAGAVYYDGRDLSRLNVKQLRRMIGAVPQDVQLHPENIWDNIAGDHDAATMEDAWRAARLASVDREIRAMPMRMLTSVGSSADVTSGGESQRINIAHALIRNPRILLLDEATNWLDNENQAKVMANLAQLSSTRIVIAHRPSTLRHADRIYVLEAGRVVQEGSFAKLVESEGVFRDLVRRQVA